VTGYIGGDILYALEKSHPEYEVTAIVRNSDKGGPVAAAYPKIRLAYGTLEDSKLLEDESARADVVIRQYQYAGQKLQETVLKLNRYG
jgi:N-acetyl-gamma-glutamylphosphate reductase